MPPRGRMPRVDSIVSSSYAPSIGPRQPSRKPTISRPWSSMPRRTTARITAFRPGQSPPPVSTPIRTLATIPTLVRMARRGHDERQPLGGTLACASGLHVALGRLPRRTATATSRTASRATWRPSTRARRATASPPPRAGRCSPASGARSRSAAGARAGSGSGCASSPPPTTASAPWDPGAGGRERAAARRTTRPPSPTSASSTTAPPPCRCRSRTTPALLQVSPGDGLTSLTRRPPGRPRAGPERYYPADRRSFVRVGPTDLQRGERLVELLGDAGRDALRARLRPRDLRPRAGGAAVVARAARRARAGRLRGVPRTASTTSRTSPAPLAEKRPDAVVQLGVAGRGDAPDDGRDRRPAPRRAGVRGERDARGARAGAPSRPRAHRGRRPARSGPRRAGYEAMRLRARRGGRGRPRPPPRDRRRPRLTAGGRGPLAHRPASTALRACRARTAGFERRIPDTIARLAARFSPR